MPGVVNFDPPEIRFKHCSLSLDKEQKYYLLLLRSCFI